MTTCIDNSDRLTEKGNFISEDIDSRSVEEMVSIFQDQDLKLAEQLKRNHSDLVYLIGQATQCICNGGRIIYIGAGTSGRIGFIDAVECLPTYGMGTQYITALIAGGQRALWDAVEGAEDDQAQAVEDLKGIHVKSKDLLIGLTASGETPYVLSAMAYAKSIGASTALLASCPKNEALHDSDIQHYVFLNSGEEIIRGSTRLKAGSATKMFLNAFSTLTMVRLGRTFGNLMVDLKNSNTKLSRRSQRILDLTGTPDKSEGKNLKQKIWTHRSGDALEQSTQLLEEKGNSLRAAHLSLPRSANNIKAFVFDMDGTVLHYKLPRGFSTWAALGWAYNIYEDMEHWIDSYKNNKMSYNDIWQECALKLKGKSVRSAQKLYFSSAGSPPLHRGFRDFIKHFGNTHITGLITSGIGMVSKHIKQELDLSFEAGNHFDEQNEIFTGSVHVDVPFNNKLLAFHKMIQSKQIEADQVCFVGDSSNDYEIFKNVKYPVFYRNEFNTQEVPPEGVPVIHDFYELFHLAAKL